MCLVTVRGWLHDKAPSTVGALLFIKTLITSGQHATDDRMLCQMFVADVLALTT